MATGINRVYEEAEPTSEWTHEEAYDTLIIYLPGYNKEHLKIQVTSSRNIRVLGERSVGHGNKWQRFRKEFPIPANCDTDDISAKFESGILYVKLPKTIAREQTQKPPTPEAQKPPTAEAQKPPMTEAQKPLPQEAQKPTITDAQKPPITEVPKPQQPMSGRDHQQAQKPQTTEAQKPLPKDAPKSGSDDQQVASKGPMDHKQKQTTGSKANGHTEKEKAAESSNAAAQQALEKEKSATNDGQEDGVDKCYYRPPQVYNYRQFVDELVRDQLKQPRRLVKLVLAFSFFLVLGMYVKYAINSIKEFKRQEL